MKRRISLFVTVCNILCAFFLFSSCKKTDTTEMVALLPSADVYYYGEATTRAPALENFKFYFPIVTKVPCTSVDNLSFYYRGEKIELDSVNNLTLYPIETTTNDNGNGWRYELTAKLNKHDMGELLRIDRVDMELDGILLSFPVDISIRYQYMRNEYCSQLWQCYLGQLTKDGVQVNYRLFPGSYCGEGKITSIDGKIMDMADTVSMRLLDNNGNSYDVWDTILKTNTYYYLEVTYTGLHSSFVADTLNITFSYEGGSVTYCTNEGELMGGANSYRMEDPVPLFE